MPSTARTALKVAFLSTLFKGISILFRSYSDDAMMEIDCESGNS
jgi:hypothetical protein